MENANEDSKNEKSIKDYFIEVANDIWQLYRSFNLYITVKDIEILEDVVIYGVLPETGVRVKTIISYKSDLAVKLGTELDIKLVPEKGYVGIFIPIDYFCNRYEEVKKYIYAKREWEELRRIEQKLEEEKKRLEKQREINEERFAEAGRIIIEKQIPSIGLIQRCLKVGFNQASRIMDELEGYGVVSGECYNGPRKILMTLEQFEELLRTMDKV